MSLLNVTVREHPRTEALITLSKLKLSLGIEDSAQDERLQELIDDVSDSVVQYCGKHFARARVTERVEGHGHVTLMLARTPIQFVEEVRFRDEVQSASGYRIADAEAGLLYDEDGWTSTQPFVQWIEQERVNQAGKQDWHVDYIGGYLMPDDDFTSLACVASGVENSFNLSGEEVFPLLIPGEKVKVAGFTNVENNGTFVVISRTATKVIVDHTLVHEVASGVVAINTYIKGNGILPRDLSRIIVAEVRDRFRSERRDSSIQSERIGDWSATYGQPTTTTFTNDQSGLTPTTQQALQRYVRVM